jgi:hypothetical protein
VLDAFRQCPYPVPGGTGRPFAFATDPQDDTQIITQTKNSLGISDLPSLAYHVTEAVVPNPAGDARVGQFVLDGEGDRTVRDILGTRDGGEEQDEKTRAENNLREALAEGPRRTTDVEGEAREVHDIQAPDLKRARSSLRISTAKRGNSWWISLPEHEGDLRDLPEDETPPPGKSAKRGPRMPLKARLAQLALFQVRPGPSVRAVRRPDLAPTARAGRVAMRPGARPHHDRRPACARHLHPQSPPRQRLHHLPRPHHHRPAQHPADHPAQLVPTLRRSVQGFRGVRLIEPPKESLPTIDQEKLAEFSATHTVPLDLRRAERRSVGRKMF